MKNKIIIAIFSAVIISTLIFVEYKTKYLPKPTVTGGQRGQLGIDKNINEKNIDKYLNREDSVYRDMRMFKDEANYEKIGGDTYISGFVSGFEVIPFPYIVYVTGLPKEVGNTYSGETLYTKKENGKYVANYKESQEILEYYFPKDKYIFLMCGGGGYAGMMKNMLVDLGWDEDMIYNVGGYWFYKGKNNEVIKTVRSNETVYDFWKVTYHDFNFDLLHDV